MTPALSPSNKQPRIRVMVVDDSAVVRGFVVRILNSDPTLEIVATCSNGETAIAQIARCKPDVVLLDIEMPVMDGLTALPKMLAADPDTRVIMASTLTQKNAEVSLEALARGATDYIPKPTARDLNGNESFSRDLLIKIRGLGTRDDVRPSGQATSSTRQSLSSHPGVKLRDHSVRDPRILAIGSSTGGPQALITLLGALPKHINVPIVIAQHMPATFTTVLAQHLGRASGRPSTEAANGQLILPGRIYVAPGDFHFEIMRSGTNLLASLNKAPQENFCRPSVNPLFRSVVRAFGGQAVAVMLTGMGSDGLEGTRNLADAGAAVVAQDEATSVVWGMPGAIATAGLCSAVLPLAGIAPHLGTLFGGSRR